jgi:hypothetical protein
LSFFKKKKEKKFIRGGFRQFRKPSVFGSSQKLVNKKPEKPPITFSQIKKIFIALAVLFVTWLLFFSSFFAIKDVLVEGNNLVSKETISDYAPVGHNIFRYKIGQTKKNFAKRTPRNQRRNHLQRDSKCNKNRCLGRRSENRLAGGG